MAVVAVATTPSLTSDVVARAGLARTSANQQICRPGRRPTRLAAGRAGRAVRHHLAAHHSPVVGAGGGLPGHPLADRVEDGHALADQPGRDLTEAVGAVQ